ncbi:hypothetical protein JOJ87_004343 [Rhodococcus ruber]|nr:hypothetical protein [Rhodococcus ruber]
MAPETAATVVARWCRRHVDLGRTSSGICTG